MCLGKGAGGASCNNAIVAEQKSRNVFTPGTHGSTSVETPLHAPVGVAAIEVLETGALVGECFRLGERFRRKHSAPS